MNDETKTMYTLVKYRPSWPARDHFFHITTRDPSCHENVRATHQNRIVSSRITSYLDRKQRRTTKTGRTSRRRSRAGNISPPSASWPVSRRCSSLSSSAINENATDGLMSMMRKIRFDSEGSLAHLVTHVSCAQNRRERTHLTKYRENYPSPLFVHQPTTVSTMRDSTSIHTSRRQRRLLSSTSLATRRSLGYSSIRKGDTAVQLAAGRLRPANNPPTNIKGPHISSR